MGKRLGMGFGLSGDHEVWGEHELWGDHEGRPYNSFLMRWRIPLRAWA